MPDGDEERDAALGDLLVATLRELGVETEPATPEPVLLRELVGCYRRILSERRREREEESRAAGVAHRRFLTELERAAAGRKPGAEELDAAEVEILTGVRDLIGARELLERELAEARSSLAEAEHRLERTETELAAMRGFRSEPDADERLRLYRRAFADWEAGRDPGRQLEAIREIERVFALTPEEETQARNRLRHCLDALARHLSVLHRILPLTEDPKRFRPRRFGGNRYRFDTLPGLIEAYRDAAEDCRALMEQARQLAGIDILGRAMDELRPVFREMVRLVADCRKQASDKTTLSSMVDLRTTMGMASLPAILGKDIQALLRTGKGKERAGDVVPLLEECVELYRSALADAIGALPDPPKVNKRAKAPGRLKRLNQDLLCLAATQQRALYQAAEKEWELHPGEKALLDDPHLLLRALQDVDAGCDVLAVLRGAPATEGFSDLPSARGFALKDLVPPCSERCRWLAEVTRYRIEPVEA